MLEQRKYTADEIEKIITYAHTVGNLQGAIEAQDHRKYFGKVVIVKNGKEAGKSGIVFWLSRVHFGQNQWSGYATRVGIRLENGETIFVTAKSVDLIKEIEEQ